MDHIVQVVDHYLSKSAKSSQDDAYGAPHFGQLWANVSKNFISVKRMSKYITFSTKIIENPNLT